MVVAVQCPNPKCRKFMLVEDVDSKKSVSCLLCKTAFRVAGPAAKESEQAGQPSDSKRKSP